MNSTEILEGNTLIAEFIGGIVVDKIFICNEKTKSYNERCLHHYNISQAKYYSSWDWLMPVVEKIESLGFIVEIASWQTCLYKKPAKENFNYNILANSKIESAWIATVEFIKYYNKQKQQ